jgi:hypothetical protein
LPVEVVGRRWFAKVMAPYDVGTLLARESMRAGEIGVLMPDGVRRAQTAEWRTAPDAVFVLALEPVEREAFGRFIEYDAAALAEHLGDTREE